MSALLPPPEVITRFTPIGVRLWDFVTQEVVSEGLRLTVEGQPRAEVTVNPHGIFALGNLSGLRALESGESDGPTGSPPTAITPEIRVCVDDDEGRFLSFSFTVQAPTAGIAALTCEQSSPPLSWPRHPVGRAQHAADGGAVVLQGRTPDAGRAGGAPR